MHEFKNMFIMPTLNYAIFIAQMGVAKSECPAKCDNALKYEAL